MTDKMIQADLRRIKGIVFDFDGVFTDNQVFVFEDGSEAVVCSRSDGLGISRVRRLGIEMVIISTETNPVVTKRAQKLKLPVMQSVDDKLAAVKAWSKQNQIEMKCIAYLGNDINDQDCLQHVGLPVVVADAMPEIIPFARLILREKGGKGAVRELCDMLWQAHHKGT